MHFPLGTRGNNFDSQIKIIYSWSKRIPFASSGPFCACTIDTIWKYPQALCFVPALWKMKQLSMFCINTLLF